MFSSDDVGDDDGEESDTLYSFLRLAEAHVDGIDHRAVDSAAATLVALGGSGRCIVTSFLLHTSDDNVHSLVAGGLRTQGRPVLVISNSVINILSSNTRGCREETPALVARLTVGRAGQNHSGAPNAR